MDYNSLLANQQQPRGQLAQAAPAMPQSPLPQEPYTAGNLLGQFLGVKTPVYGGDNTVRDRITDLAKHYTGQMRQNWMPYMPKEGTPTLGARELAEQIRQFDETQKYRYAALAAQRAAAAAANSAALKESQAKSALMNGFYQRVNELRQPTPGGKTKSGRSTGYKPGLSTADAIKAAIPEAMQGAGKLGLGADFVMEMVPHIEAAYGITPAAAPMSQQEMAKEWAAGWTLNQLGQGNLQPDVSFGYDFYGVPLVTNPAIRQGQSGTQSGWPAITDTSVITPSPIPPNRPPIT